MGKERIEGLVSVVIPCYNHGAFIRQTVQSALNQTYDKFEIIIVNDGSDDNLTIETLKSIDHPKVVVMHKENGHVSSARNYGIKHSNGEYILTLDADDMFEPDFLEKAVPVFKKDPVIGVVTCNAKLFNHKGITGYQHKLGGGAKSFVYVNNCLASALFRFDCWDKVKGFNESMRDGFEDWDFWLSVTSAGWKVHSIPEYLYWYRDMPNSMVKGATLKKPMLMKTLAQNHMELFCRNIAEVIYTKEKMIQELSEVQHSLTYKVGDAVLFPFKFLRGVMKTGFLHK